jgi:autotransporter-associated beta strand protein
MKTSTTLKSCKQTLLALVGVAFLIGFTQSVQAAARTWSGGDNIWAAGIQGGWSAIWTNGDTGTFSGPGGNVTVTNAITTGNAALAFSAGNYSLTGATAVTITLGNNNVTLGSGVTTTIGTNVVLARSGGFVVDGNTTATSTLNINAGGKLDGTSANAASIIETTVNVNGGVLENGTSIVIGNTANGAALNVSAGAVNIEGTAANLVFGNGGVTSTVNGSITGGAITFVNAANTGGIRFGGNASGNTTSTFDLNGGTVTSLKVYKASGGTVNCTFNFNGGTLKALNNNTTDFMTGLTRANVRNNGAVLDLNGKNITIGQALEHSNVGGDLAVDGGLTLNDTAATKGSLTLSGANTYTGPTTINAGTLIVPTPYSSIPSPVVNNGGKLRVNLSDSSSDFGSTLTLNDGARTEFNFGTYDANYVAGITNANLVVPNGTTNFIDISGTGIPVSTNILLAYTNKTGTGTFQLGTQPPGMAATLTDSGSNLVLKVTSPSANLYTWAAGTGDWDIGTSFNWNSFANTYSEPAVVVFPDNASGTVTIATNVSPFDIDVIVTNAGSYTFTGPGSIKGTTGIDIVGTNSVTLGTSNSFSGVVTVSGGSGTVGAYVIVTNAYALGVTNGGTVVNGPANTLALGTVSGDGVTVSGETITITGTGLGGARGALRGTASTTPNVWAGPVVLAANNARIGIEPDGNLTVSGPITDNGAGYGPILRASPSTSALTLSGAGNTWSGNTTLYGEGRDNSTVKSGVLNAFPTNSFLYVGNCKFDMNGFDQTSTGIGLSSGASATNTVIGNSGAVATLTLDGTNDFSFTCDVIEAVAIVKNNTNAMTLSGANLTYTGNTTVNVGRLTVTSTNALVSSFSVASNATIAGEFTTTGSLTLNAGAALIVNPSTTNSLTANTVSASTGPISVSFSSAFPEEGDILVLAAPGGITANTNNFQAVGARGGTFYLANADKELYFTPTGVLLTWKGNDPTNPTFWDVTTTTNWDKAGSPDMFYTGDSVSFDDSASNFNVAIQGASVIPSSVTFNSASNYFLSGGAIAGAATLTKSGSGLLTLSNANSYSGGTTISGGAVEAKAANSLGTNVAEVASGAALHLTAGAVTYTTRLGGTGTVNVVVGTGTGSTLLNNNNSAFAGTLNVGTNGVTAAVAGAGAGKLQLNGPLDPSAVIHVLTNATVYTTTTTPHACAITLQGGDTGENLGQLRLDAGALWSGPVTVAGPITSADDGIIGANSGNTGTISGSIGETGGSQPLTKAGSGTVVLSGVNTYSGQTTVRAGTLSVAHPNALGSTASGTVVNSSAILSVVSNVVVAAEPLSLKGAGGNNYGALQAGIGGGTWSGTIFLDDTTADAPRLGAISNEVLTVTGSVTNGIGSRVNISGQAGTGAVVLNPTTSNTYTGVTAIIRGILRLGKNNALPLGTTLDIDSVSGISDEAVFDMAGFDQTVDKLQDTATTSLGAKVSNSSSARSTLTVTGISTFDGIIEDGFSGGQLALVKTTGGTLTLSGTGNSYTGPTRVEAGTLALALPMSSTNLTLQAGSALSLTVGGSSWFSLSAMNVTNSALTYDFGSSPWSGPILTTGDLNVGGTNVINIAGTGFSVGQITLIDYTTTNGPGVFQLGTVAPGLVCTLTNDGSAVLLDVIAVAQTLTWYGSTSGTWNTNGTLDWNFAASAYQEYGAALNRVGDFATFDDSALDFIVDITTPVRPSSITVNNTATNYVFSGSPIGGSGSLTKSGTNVLTLATPNTFSGGSTVSGGTLAFTNGALGSSGNVILATGGTLQWGDSNSEDLSSRLRFNGNSASVSDVLDIGTNNVTFATGLSQSSTGGPILNQVTKLGSGTLTLAGPTNRFGNFVRFNAGTVEVVTGSQLTVDGNGTASTGALIVDNAALQVNGGTVSVSDRLALASVTGSTGALSVVSGTLTVEVGSTAASRGLRVAGGSDATYVGHNTVAAVQLNGGTLAVARVFPGVGTNNTSTFSFNGGILKATTNVVAGTFVDGLTHAYVSTNGAKIDTSGTNVIIGQALEHDPAVTTDGGLTKLGAGTLTLTNASTYNGNTTVSNGTLVLQHATLDTNSTVTVAGGAFLQLDFAATNAVAALVLNGVSQPGGVYDSITGSPYITGTGVLLVPSTGPVIPPFGTNLTYSATSSNITLRWPSNYTGAYLQVQTNLLNKGLSTNWTTIAGSQTTNAYTLPLTKTDPTVFFRMVHTNAP